MVRAGFFIGAFWVVLSGQVMAAESLESLVNGEQYQQAYDLALPQLEQRAGEPGFDFLYGMAAIETGHPQEALFAFERALAVEPQDHRARLELARAYFMLGNFEQSRLLFEAVLASNPPPRVRENIQRFMDQLTARKQQRDQQFSANVDFSVGIDSNINSATEVQTISLPIGLVLTLGDGSREIADEFYELAVNATYLKLLRKDSGLFAAFSLSDHENFSYNQFDLRSTGLSLGYLYKAGDQSLRVPLQWQMLEVDRTMFRTSHGAGVEWSFDYAQQQQLTLFGQWAQQRHNDSEQLRDVDLALVGAAWSYEFTPWRTKLSVSGYLADESAVDNTYDYFGRTYFGSRLAAQWQPKTDHELQLSWSQQSIKHDAIQPVFGKVREDDCSQLALEWRWRFDPHWNAGLTISNTNNSSNIDIYTYGRTQEYFSLGYDY
jgi:tetratricopeptide (TPR) repeat protein